VESRPDERPEQAAGSRARPAAGSPAGRAAGSRAGQAAAGPPPLGADQHAQAFVAGGAYALLFVFGVAQGLVGCFQFSRAASPIPLGALGFCLLIAATCLLGAAGTGSAAGAVLPAVGWFLTSLVLTMPTAQGSVIVTNTAAGEWFIYGGSACVAAAVVIVLVRGRGRAPGPDPGPGRGLGRGRVAGRMARGGRP
jgi:hypothetical protein